MRIDLSGRTAVVTGSTAGIGRATAEGLARAGASVVVNGRGRERVEEAVRQLRQAVPDGTFTGVAADLSGPDGAAALAAGAPEADILVNNLGTAAIRSFADIADEDWLSLFQLNVLSGVRASRYYLPRMVRKGWGRVVFVSSESALNIPVDMIDYGMTKAAQLAISRGLAESVAGTGVTVNAVLPGPTRSEFWTTLMTAQAEKDGVTVEEVEEGFLAGAKPTSLIKRVGTTEEVANMITYVCSEQASATTGSALRVDGGVVRYLA